MGKNIIILEQTNSMAEDPENVSGTDIPRGYSIKSTREEECDHPSTRLDVDKGTNEVYELCQVCGEEERQDIETGLQRE